MIKNILCNGLWTQALKKISISLCFLFTLSTIYSFSDSKADIQSQASSPKPYSVRIKDKKNVNMPSEGEITSEYSDSPAKSRIDKIVDNNPKTKFETQHSEFYILWNGDSDESINYYSITAANDAPEKDPKSWTFSGSKDNVTWELLDKQEEQVFTTRSEKKEFLLANKNSYKYYKLNIESNAGDASTHIAEWCMQTVYTDFDDLMIYSSSHTKSHLTPMGTFFANRHITTEEDLVWLNDAKNDAPLPPDDRRILAEFAVYLYPHGEPVYSDANQHSIGNCGVVAACASMAYIYPQFIKSIIVDNGDNTYTVSMFDPQGKRIKVSVNSKFLANRKGEILCSTGKMKIPTWATILEKAIMKYNHVYKISSKYDLDRIGKEFIPALFTGNGNSYLFAPGVLKAKDITRVIQVCLSQGKFVFGGFNVAGLPIDGSKTIKSHVYTFMGSAEKGTMFVARNPWGSNPNVGRKKDGILLVKDDRKIPRTIDIHIVEPGIAAEFGAFAY